MSIEQVNAFYDFVSADAGIYEQYYNSCCQRGMFGVWNWDTTKIVAFAASLGFNFSESELATVLFDSDAIMVTNDTTYSNVTQANYQSNSGYAYYGQA